MAGAEVNPKASLALHLLTGSAGRIVNPMLGTAKHPVKNNRAIGFNLMTNPGPVTHEESNKGASMQQNFRKEDRTSMRSMHFIL